MTTLDVQTQRMQLKADALRKRFTEENGLTLRGVRVVGRLDLAGVHLLHALRFVDCVFEDRIDLSGACLEEPIEWQGGRIAAVVADRLEAKGHMILSDVGELGAVSLRWAHLQGDLRLSNSKLQPSQGLAFDGRDVRVDGSVHLDGRSFSARGEVCLSSARIRGSLDCRKASFHNPDGRSLSADDVVVDGEVLCEDGFTAEGEVSLERAMVTRLRASGGSFRNTNGRHALHCDALRASGVFLDRGFQAVGGVRLVGADIAGELCCTRGSFENPSGIALDARRLTAEDVYLDNGFSAHGEVRLDGSLLTRQLNCTSGGFDNEQGYALDADDMQCDGDVFLDRGFSAKGEVRLVGAQIKNGLTCTGGRFDNQAGLALNADGFTTPGNAFFDSEPTQEFRALGEVRLARATVGRQLLFSGAALIANGNALCIDLTGLVCSGDVLLNKHFRASGEVRLRGAKVARDLDFFDGQLNGAPVALDAQALRVGGCLSWRLAQTPKGKVDLSFATVEQLNDALATWPDDNFVLAGFTCQRPEQGGLTVDQWIGWLAKAKGHYSDAYLQLGNSYRTNGHEADAQDIAIARQRDLRKRGDLRKGAKAWNRFLDVSTGYGYQLHRPLLALLVLAVVGAIIFYIADAAGLMQGRGNEPYLPVFQPLVYSVQLLVPLVDLQETSVWLPKTGTLAGNLLMAYVWVAILLGWLLSGALAAGIGRLFRQGER